MTFKEKLMTSQPPIEVAGQRCILGGTANFHEGPFPSRGHGDTRLRGTRVQHIMFQCEPQTAESLTQLTKAVQLYRGTYRAEPH